MEKICYIAGAGDDGGTVISPQAGDFVIAADAGLSYLGRVGVKADLAVGDFDSLGKVPDDVEVIRHPVMKDDTDMMLAVNEGLARGYTEFVIVGGLGGRLDHTLANIQTLVSISARGAHGRLVSGKMTVMAVTCGSLKFDASHKGTVSVFCVGDRADGVWLRGLKYPLCDAVLTCDRPLGVSNEFTGTESEISVRDGTLVVVFGEHFAD